MPDAIQLPRVGESWRHYKGSLYTIREIAADSETLQLRVVYTDGKLTWDRVMSGISPLTGKPCGWADPLPDGAPRYTRVS